MLQAPSSSMPPKMRVGALGSSLLSQASESAMVGGLEGAEVWGGGDDYVTGV